MNSTDINIEFRPAKKTITVKRGTPLTKAASLAGLELAMPCGGKGNCGKCKVLFEKGASAPTATETDTINEAELAQGYRLACQTNIENDSAVYITNGVQPVKALMTGSARKVRLSPNIKKRHVKIHKPSTDDLRTDLQRALDAFGLTYESPWTDINLIKTLDSDIRESGFNVTGVFAGGRLISVEAGDTASECYGIAFDIGTTTLAAYLVDLNTGKQVSAAAAMNHQAQVGDDVISRISHVMQENTGLETLRRLVVDGMNDLISSLLEGTEISRGQIYEAVVVGNTCMTHMFMGVDPRNLAISPYVPVISESLYLRADELGLNINSRGFVHILPCIAGYVGADIVGVLLSSGLYENGKYLLAIDIGTNGEMVIGSKDRMAACSTAAGPAFEGAHIKHGMRAGPGAIDSVWLDEGDFHFSTVGGAKPVGICGSGLLDAIICLIDAGIVDTNGRILDSEKLTGKYAHLRDRIISGKKGNEFVLVRNHGHDPDMIVISQRDVREVQLAKGAIAAGIYTLLDRLGIGTDDLEKILIAGAFGNYVRKESAIKAGMIPNVSREKVHSIGNAAGEGAKLALISTKLRDEADTIAKSVEYVELTVAPDFQDRFADRLAFEAGNP